MRLYTLVVSMVVHAALVVVLIVVPLCAMDALPGARQAIAFVQASAAEIPDPPPPPRPRSAANTTQAVARNVAPTEAPDRIEPETLTPDTSAGPPDGPPGVPGGDPAGVLFPHVPIPDPPRLPPTGPVRPGGVIRRPQKIRDVAPVYPPIARSAGVSGTVILEAVIGENGRVRDARVLRSIPLLDQAALDAVRQWQFTPTLLNGEPVPVVMTVTVAFELR